MWNVSAVQIHLYKEWDETIAILLRAWILFFTCVSGPFADGRGVVRPAPTCRGDAHCSMSVLLCAADRPIRPLRPVDNIIEMSYAKDSKFGKGVSMNSPDMTLKNFDNEAWPGSRDSRNNSLDGDMNFHERLYWRISSLFRQACQNQERVRRTNMLDRQNGACMQCIDR